MGLRKLAAVVALALCAGASLATQTENTGIRIVPAPGKVAIDGKPGDWDRSGGLLICDDVENQRDQLGVWLFGMWDQDNVYILAHFLDQSPLNNPGQTIADYGFAGDSLQLRFILAPGTPAERTSHWTMWKGADNRDLMDVAYGKRFNEGGLKNAKDQGGQQAFAVDEQGKGYYHELAIPWKLLTKDGVAPAAGSQFIMTAEPNFTVGINGRLSIKDIFKPGVTPDRVFAFQANDKWGPAYLLAKGNVAPGPERLADAREFPMKMEQGWPVIDWTGLIQTKELPGFKTITFEVPADGYVSLNIKAADGTVVRHLLNQAFYTKGKHSVKWDGLSTWNWLTPGQPVAPGDYTWSALWHSGLGLKLRGWAANAGREPYDNGPGTNWGGDHGVPSSAAADATRVYLGWTGAEAGQSVVATDLTGGVKWTNKRGGIGGAKALAVDGKTLYVLGGTSGLPSEGGSMYKLNAADGRYLPWGDSPDADLSVKKIWGDTPADATLEKAERIAARDGKLYLSFSKAGKVAVLDGATGKLERTLEVPGAWGLAAGAAGLYVHAAGDKLVRVNPADGSLTTVLEGIENARGVAIGPDGRLYVAFGAPKQQVAIYTADGKRAGTIGRPGGRALLGKWTPDGLVSADGLAVDGEGKLWVAEHDGEPKRISAWDTKTSKLYREYFGPSSYGALGGAISPLDPNIMVGQGCEWKLDPATGKAVCTGVITREGMEVSRFGQANGRLYLTVAPGWIHGSPFISVFERVGEGDYKLRSRFTFTSKEVDKKQVWTTTFWADVNGDQQVQPEEQKDVPGRLMFSGWYMGMTPDMTIYKDFDQYKLAGFTPAGAPIWDVANPVKLPNSGESGGMGANRGLGSADGKIMLYNAQYGVNNGWMNAYEIATGRKLWSYPSNFVGVHGSHNAIPPTVGMIRGAYDLGGVAELPAPIGGVFVVPTNVGEWHLVTQDGFYLARLFQGDPLKVQWPAQAIPGADMTNTPPGMGGEDFGGSTTLARDGKLYIQAGKTGFWNLEVTGLENVKAVTGGKLAIAANEPELARQIREAAMQEAVGLRRTNVKKLTPKFTGNLDADFKGADQVRYSKSDEAAVRTALAWDETNLYVGWDVRDNTPLVNAATDVLQMYTGGDTVDLQLGANAKADPKRGEAVAGDLRLSLGKFDGKPVAVLYRKVSLGAEKRPHVFSSGVVRAYTMEWVDVVTLTDVKVTPRGNGYVIEAAVPWALLGVTPAEGLKLRGDVGATHGDPAGTRTRLRSYWSNQHTGIVDDAVFELQMEPKHWGELTLMP